jgi:GNAT superfamily N-acetyltransferase
MYQIKESNSDHPDFKLLVKELDADLKIRDGEEHAFYAHLNATAILNHVVILYHDTIPVGCGALRPINEQQVEIKRMFVAPAFRRKGIASMILAALEKSAAQLGYSSCILETGKNQPEAIALYLKAQFQIIPNYGHYKDVANSVCFEKVLSSTNNEPISQ